MKKSVKSVARGSFLDPRTYTGLVLVLGIVLGLFIACSPESPKLVPPQTAKPEQVRDTSGIKISFNRSVDILFVIDDSGSMSSHQFNLAKNIGLFTAGINSNQVLDYHIGVLTSNMDTDPWRPAVGYGWKGELNGAFVMRVGFPFGE